MIIPSIYDFRPPAAAAPVQPSMATPKLPPRPNTVLHYILFTPHNLPMPAGPLKTAGWKRLTAKFQDQEVIAAILSVCQYGARIGYCGQRTAPTIYPNLPTVDQNAAIVTQEIESEMRRGRLEVYLNRASLPRHYTASPLGLTDKSDGSKRRIHHLSYPTGSAYSIKYGIPEEYGAIRNSTLEDAIQAVQDLGKECSFIKRDFESAFRHVPISPLDSPLLGFHWENTFYAQRYLPFGLRTAPYLFNLFAELFHWGLETQF